MINLSHRIPIEAFRGAMFLKFVAICMVARILTCDAQKNPQGFLNIDCGSKSASYNDPETGLTWENDGHYTLTGMNGMISEPISRNLSNREALRSFRYFPKHRNKHCYELPMPEKNTSFLIRAMFFPVGSSQLKPPIEFSVYVDSSLWFTLQYDKLDSTAQPDIREGIFYSPGRKITHFCLVPTTGVPFISSLETRLLDSEGLMYSLTENDHRTLFFTTLMRWSAIQQDSTDTPAIRYPDDEYDRLWTAPSEEFSDQLGLVADGAPSSKLNTSVRVNYAPLKAMLMTWDENDFNTSLNTSWIDFTLNLPKNTAANILNGRYVYTTLYFSPPDDNSGQNMTIQWNYENPLRFYLKPGISIQSYEHKPISRSSITLSLESTSTFWPNLNAIEVYEENVLSQLITDSEYVSSTVDILKNGFNLTDWQGDPCVPVPYSWLTCQPYDAFTAVENGGVESITVNSLTLSNVTNTTSLLNLSNKFFVGLNSMSVTHSDMDDDTFQFILSSLVALDLYKYGDVIDLDFTSNNITQLPRHLDAVVRSLNLSHNALKGALFFPEDSFDSLEYFNLSHNALTSPSHTIALNLTELSVLDLSYNKFDDQGFLEKFVQQNNDTLQEIYVSYNNLTGKFSTSFYISNLISIKTLNFSGNSINGTLNLTPWHSMLESVVSVNASNISSIMRLFSLTNNKIQDISPPAEDFKSLFEALIHIQGFNESGFLLGGNPYCKGAKILSQRYFCRYSIHDSISEYSRKRKSRKFILPTILGALALIFGCISIATIWKLWLQVKRLQEIQKALSERKVQPPLYLYRDLKHATRNFRKDNELGRGGFGAVYKGTLADGTTVAVKQLFNSQQKQVLDEFLNEVVLITGIKHKNLAQLKGCCITSSERILVYEFAHKGNLAEALWGRGVGQILQWNTRFNICVGIARGLSYLHEELQPRIIHRDIKAANILLDSKWTPKIADFGLARPFLEEDAEAFFTHVAGTRGYLAPEYYEGQLTEKVDVYSFGILLLEIVSGRKCIDTTLPEDKLYLKTWAEKLYQDGMLLELLDPGLRKNGTYNEAEVTRVINVALICVQIDPKFRATMFQATTMLIPNVDVSGHLKSAMNHDSGIAFDITSASGSSYTDHSISGGFPYSVPSMSGSKFNSLYNDTKKSFRKIRIEKSEDFSEDVAGSPLLLNSVRTEESQITKPWNTELTPR